MKTAGLDAVERGGKVVKYVHVICISVFCDLEVT